MSNSSSESLCIPPKKRQKFCEESTDDDSDINGNNDGNIECSKQSLSNELNIFSDDDDGKEIIQINLLVKKNKNNNINEENKSNEVSPTKDININEANKSNELSPTKDINIENLYYDGSGHKIIYVETPSFLNDNEMSISGDTFGIKDLLKQNIQTLKWRPDQRGWIKCYEKNEIDTGTYKNDIQTLRNICVPYNISLEIKISNKVITGKKRKRHYDNNNNDIKELPLTNNKYCGGREVDTHHSVNHMDTDNEENEYEGRIIMKRRRNKIILKGYDTYHIKEDLKEMGFKYDANRKSWSIGTDDPDVTGTIIQNINDIADSMAFQIV